MVFYDISADSAKPCPRSFHEEEPRLAGASGRESFKEVLQACLQAANEDRPSKTMDSAGGRTNVFDGGVQSDDSVLTLVTFSSRRQFDVAA